MLSIWKSLKFVVWERVNPFSSRNNFISRNLSPHNDPEEETFRNLYWKRNKMILNNTFSFSNNFFYPYQRQIPSLYPHKTNLFGDILESACLSMCPFVHKILFSVKALTGIVALSDSSSFN